jgi:DNA polymerase elongation subunit (family B)
LYLKYTFTKLPRFNLESIARHELGEGKVNHDEFTDFEDFYQHNYNTFLEYGNKDIELLIMLENKLKLIETAKYLAYMCGVNIPDVFGTYKQWHSLVYNTALKQNIILPLKQQYRNENDGFPGGWVVSKPGKYDWIISFDYNSLYPRTAQALNYGLDSLVKPEEEPEELKELRKKYFSWYSLQNCDKLKEISNNLPEEHDNLVYMMEHKKEIHSVLEKYNVCASPNGYFYRKDKQSLFGYLMGKLYDERLQAKANIKKYESLMNAKYIEATE